MYTIPSNSKGGTPLAPLQLVPRYWVNTGFGKVGGWITVGPSVSPQAPGANLTQSATLFFRYAILL